MLHSLQAEVCTRAGYLRVTSVEHTHKVKSMPCPLKAQMRAVVNVSIEKKQNASVSRSLVHSNVAG